MKRINYLLFLLLTVFIFTKSCNIPANAAKDDKSIVSNPIIYVFPVEYEKPINNSQEVFTGTYYGDQLRPQAKSKETPKRNNRKKTIEKQPVKEILPPQINVETIAWIASSNSYYHDPINNCLNIDDKTWISDKEDLLGLEPCPDCFKKRGIIPAFIAKNIENKEIAEADKLLINSEFVKYISERLPIKGISFVSSNKVYVYPSLEMTNKGLYQLATKVQNAYLQKTWRVIEVLAKPDAKSNEFVSSFSDRKKYLGGVEAQKNIMENTTLLNDNHNKSY